MNIPREIFTKFNMVSRENPAETKSFFIAGVSFEDTVIHMIYTRDHDKDLSKFDIKYGEKVVEIPADTCDFTFTPAYKAIFWD